MNNKWIRRYWWLPLLVAGAGLSSFTLFDMNQTGSSVTPVRNFNATYTRLADTLPDAKDDEHWEYNFRTGELDKAIADMEREVTKAKTEFKNRDWKKVEDEMQRALKEMEKIDMSKLKQELEESFNKEDFEKMQKELKRSLDNLNEVELPKIKKQLHEELSKQLAESEKQLAKTKEHLQQQKEKMKLELGDSFSETMKNLDVTLSNARDQLKEFKKMTAELEKDGLIQKGENAEIRFKNGELFINGKKQSKEVSDKYKHYFKKDQVRINLNDNNDDWI